MNGGTAGRVVPQTNIFVMITKKTRLFYFVSRYTTATAVWTMVNKLDLTLKASRFGQHDFKGLKFFVKFNF